MKMHNSLSVNYETQILENGRVISTRPYKRNLLLDSGLDSIAVRSFWATFSHCALGDATTPTKRDSGAITVAINAEVATASAGFFAAGDVGRLIKLDSGQEVYIDGFTSSVEVSVSGAVDDPSSEFTVWYVNETGHGNEIVRTGNLGGDSGDNSRTWDGTKLILKRTFLFPTESGARTYKEIGWSHTATAGQNLLGRDLIPGGGDSISAGQQYKVVVILNVDLAASVPVAIDDVGTGGWNTSGDAIAHDIYGAFDSIYSGFGGLEPYRAKRIGGLTSDFTLPAAPNSSDAPGSVSYYKTLSKGAYIAGSHEVTHYTTLSVGEFNGDIYGLCILPTSGANAFGGVNRCMLFKFDTPQTKDSDHTLSLAFKFSWGRALVN